MSIPPSLPPKPFSPRQSQNHQQQQQQQSQQARYSYLQPQQQPEQHKSLTPNYQSATDISSNVSNVAHDKKLLVNDAKTWLTDFNNSDSVIYDFVLANSCTIPGSCACDDDCSCEGCIVHSNKKGK